MNLLTIGWCVLLAIFVACLPMSRFVRMGMQLLTLGLFVGNFFWSIDVADYVIGGWRWIEPEELAAVAALYGGTGALLFTLAVAAVTPAAANRALLPRLCFVLIWAAIGGVFSRGPQDGMEIWSWLMTMGLSFGLLAAIGERDQLNRRLAAKVPRNRLLRLPAFFFFSGAASGLAWTLVMLVATVAIAHAHSDVPEPERLEVWAWLCVAYALAAMFLARHTPLTRWVAPVHTFAVALILIALGAMFPVVGSVLRANLVMDQIADEWWIPSVLATFHDSWHTQSGFAAYRSVTIIAARGAAAVMVVASAPWFLRRVAAFRPPQEQVLQPPSRSAAEFVASESPPGTAPMVSEEASRG
jgi:hypothetical protein